MILQHSFIFNNVFLSQILQKNAMYAYIDGLVQDCSNSIANALELS